MSFSQNFSFVGILSPRFRLSLPAENQAGAGRRRFSTGSKRTEEEVQVILRISYVSVFSKNFLSFFFLKDFLASSFGAKSPPNLARSPPGASKSPPISPPRTALSPPSSRRSDNGIFRSSAKSSALEEVGRPSIRLSQRAERRNSGSISSSPESSSETNSTTSLKPLRKTSEEKEKEREREKVRERSSSATDKGNRERSGSGTEKKK